MGWRLESTKLILGNLERMLKLSPNEVGSWFTPPELLGPSAREITPDGRFDFGLAHGLAGVITYLAQVVRADLFLRKSLPLLRQATNTLIGARRDDLRLGQFPYYAGHFGLVRSGWCYGDPGVACALISSGLAAQEASWIDLGIQVLLDDLARPFDDSGVLDGGLCHGAAGLAHIYQRMYRATNDERLLQGVRHWSEILLNFESPEDGYCAWNHPKGRSQADSSFLTGSAGIGLFLLSAVFENDMQWDAPLSLGIGR